MRNAWFHVRTCVSLAAVGVTAGVLMWRAHLWDDPTGNGILPCIMCGLMAMFLAFAWLASGSDENQPDAPEPVHGRERQPQIPQPVRIEPARPAMPIRRYRRSLY
jgi:hypothetical protein